MLGSCLIVDPDTTRLCWLQWLFKKATRKPDELSNRLVESSWKRQWEQVSELNKLLDQPVWIRKYLARKFYSQNKLPVELNLIIEEMLAADYARPL